MLLPMKMKRIKMKMKMMEKKKEEGRRKEVHPITLFCLVSVGCHNLGPTLSFLALYSIKFYSVHANYLACVVRGRN
jgi:hypothetical protein